VIRSPLFFGQVDVWPGGVRTRQVWTDHDRSDEDTGGVRWGLPFPVACARPPALGFQQGQRDGHLHRGGRGVLYERKPSPAGTTSLEIQATYFRKRRGFRGSAPSGVAWYSAQEIGDVAKDAPDTWTLYRETQTWQRPDDWLWSEMRRHHKDGYILMRCRQLSPDPATERP